MSSSTANQSAENCIANGLTFNIADIDITAPKLNKSGGKSANILYKPSKKSLYINMTVPMLTWGASMFKDPQSGKETYDMSIQFPRKDYSTPDTDTLLAKFQELEKYIKGEAVKNSMAWFNKKTMTPEVIEALWTPMLKYSKDPQTGEQDMTKAPTLKVKLPFWDGKFNCEIYDPQGTMLYPDEHACSSPMELIPKGVNIVAIVQCGGLWFANGKFGCTWRLFQTVVQPKPSMKGKCLITVSPAAKSALVAAASAANEASMEIEDDSDVEPEIEEPPVKSTPIPTRPVPTPVVQPIPKAPTIPVTPAPVQAVPEVVAEQEVVAPVEAAAAVVVKKKVVRKKE
jgi:hypothetical protein